MYMLCVYVCVSVFAGMRYERQKLKEDVDVLLYCFLLYYPDTGAPH